MPREVLGQATDVDASGRRVNSELLYIMAQQTRLQRELVALGQHFPDLMFR